MQDDRFCHLVLPLIPEIEQETQKDMSIVILKGDVTINFINRIPRPIRRKIDSDNYLQWTDDPDGREVFWRSLCRMMDDRQPIEHLRD